METIHPVIEIKRTNWPEQDAPQWHTWLRVGVQTFQVGLSHPNPEEAAWFAGQLHTALQRAGTKPEIREAE